MEEKEIYFLAWPEDVPKMENRIADRGIKTLPLNIVVVISEIVVATFGFVFVTPSAFVSK